VRGAIKLLYIASVENAVGSRARVNNPPPKQEKLVKNSGRNPKIPLDATLVVPQFLFNLLE
jgi:hypothetical protein